MATIKEVAAAAGVQPATVSYVMNGTGSVSEATRQRVLAAAAALAYQPSHVARSLQRRRSRTLGLPLPKGRTSARIGMLLSGIADGATAAGYDLLLAAYSEQDETATYANLYRSGRIEGLVILDVRQDDERVEAAQSLGIPHVCEGRPGNQSPFVAIDVEAGTMEALAHLIVLGHERIGLITPSFDLALATEQDAAYRAALEEAGLRFEEQFVVEGGSTESEGYAAASDLLSLPEPPSAILAGSAALAFGTLHAAYDAGRQVGDDLALIVFDDPSSAAHAVPPLTAVRQPVWDVGRALAELLVGVIEGTAADSIRAASIATDRSSLMRRNPPTTVGRHTWRTRWAFAGTIAGERTVASIKFEHVEKYFGNVHVLKDLNIDVADREFLVLVGPSGCGKTTALRLLAGLEEISDGSIYIGDRRVNDVAPKDRDIAMVFQSYALYPHMSVYDNMAFGLKLRKTPKAEIDRRVKEAADMLSIAQYLDRKPKALSGGQRQRVALGTRRRA